MQLADLPLLAGTINYYQLRPQTLALCTHTPAKTSKVDAVAVDELSESSGIAE
jgi:hypothetical protein